ncbi:hypothetical protein PO124_21710 [Bacillus licheniformis]|nr:hypothetical protein [Bacillus licheniformis]
MNDGKGRFEVTPLNIREATPTPLGKSDFLKRKAIFRQLTKEQTSTGKKRTEINV